MPDILLFGATGYTGKLTARALARRGASFAIAGRDRAKLEALASVTGDPEVRVAAAGDVQALTRAVEDVGVLITCVGPFVELGKTAVEAALRAKVHYIDSAGEGAFVGDLIGGYDARAREAGIVMAPAMGFDEVPADVAATLSTRGMKDAELYLTYSLNVAGSAGTIRSALPIIASKGPWLEEHTPRPVGAGEEQRWAPMPPPLGPRPTVSFPFAEGHLAPLHLDLRSLRLYTTTGTAQRAAMRFGLPVLRSALGFGPTRKAIETFVSRLDEGPDEQARGKGFWTILAEARSEETWRNVAITGRDVYGLTAELLTGAALKMVEPGYANVGVRSPVEAVGLDTLEKELGDHDVTIEVFGDN